MKRNAQPSIFELERRRDILEDYSVLVNDMKNASVSTRALNNTRLYGYLDECIRDWPFRKAASNMDRYLQNLGITDAGKDVVHTIYALELLLNL